MPPDSLNSEPDQNAIFYPLLDLVSVSNNHERGHKRDVHVLDIGQEQGVNHVIIIIAWNRRPVSSVE